MTTNREHQPGATTTEGDPSLEVTLARHFGFPAFHPGQREPIETILGGGDTVVVMPTGAGKSLCYQLPALILDGITVVISPLISLMKDQVDGLVARGLPATSLNSSLSSDEVTARFTALRQGRTRLLFVAPERFRNTRFREFLDQANVSLLAVDEAHCISQWGHDFRPDYLRLGEIARALPKARIMALTATATPEVQLDIVKQLGLGAAGRPAPQVFVRGFRRDNLRLVVSHAATHGDKLRRIERILAEFPTGIVYCSTRKQVERVGVMLREQRVGHLIYHAGLTDVQRSHAQERFLKGEMPVVVATNAFGMGVDRSDLRFVIHWDVPGSVEAYYQEVGRAGRDGALAHCELLYNYADVRTQEFFLDGSNPAPSVIQGVWNEVRSILGESPQTCPLDEWSERISSTDNKITVHTCMGLYERCGLIQREVKSGTRCYTTTLVADADAGRLTAMLPALEEKRRRDLRKLDRMLCYVNSRNCRHQYILDYFGERDATPGSCGRCDRCGFDTSIPPRPPTEDEWLIVQKLLSCIGRLEGRFGRDTILAVLAGSPAKEVIEHDLRQVPTYGALTGHRADYLRGVFDELVRAEAITLSPDACALASLTPHGRAVAWRRISIMLHWPPRESGPLPSSATDPAPSHRSRPRHADTSPSVGGSRKPPASPSPDRVLSAREEVVFDALREWRKEEAALRGSPAFTIFNNRTLKAIAIARPDSLAGLEGLHGVGPAKLEAFGDAILQLLDRLSG